MSPIESINMRMSREQQARDEVVGELMKNGKDPKTPVAMVERGTRPDQRVTIGTVETIAKISKDEGVKAPALTVIGDVVKLHEILGSQI